MSIIWSVFSFVFVNVSFFALFASLFYFHERRNCESGVEPSSIFGITITFPNASKINACDTIKEQFNEMVPWQRNAARRELQKFQPSCYEDIYSEFEIDFIRRLRQKHVSLHIPKSGGSSFCKMMHEPELNFSVPRGNCWIEPFCPYWCCCSGGSYLSCEELLHSEFDMVMNERWMDYHGDVPFCPSLFYSIIIREPVNRTMSQINHLMYNSGWRIGLTIEKLQIIEHNYITWSLLAGKSDSPKNFAPTMDDLPDAKRILSGFDIIFDVSESKCNIDLFSIMGLKIDGIPRKNAKPEYRQHFSIYDIQQQNTVDSELHKFATGLMRLDCDFIARVAKNHDRRIWNTS